MVTTITFNLAIDKSLVIENFQIDKINKIKENISSAAGKGINVSKVISFLGGETTALGIIGGNNGKEFLELIKKYSFKFDYVEVSENNRCNIKVIDLINKTCTDINEDGPFVSSEKLIEFKNLISLYLKNSEVLVLAGRLQESIPPNIYKELILENSDKKIFLDTTGLPLKLGIESKPFFIKPNIEELSELVGKNILTMDEAIYEGKKIVESGVKNVCISLGADGIILVNENEVLRATPPKVLVKSTVGAGDCIVGVFAKGFLDKMETKDMLKLACGVSCAKVTLSGTEIPNMELVKEITSKVKIDRK